MYDAIIIGSGLGGLTAAALLAKAGRKICVLERNHSIGGAASAFKSGALHIEPSLHQTADPHDPADPKHAILKSLGLLDEIAWTPVSPFHTVQGEQVRGEFDLPTGLDAARAALAERFPGSKDGIDSLFASIERLQTGVMHLEQSRSERSLFRLAHAGIELRDLVRDWRLSVDDVLQRALGDAEGAKLALAANIAYYADDPRRLSWPFFALAQGGFLRSGGVYIKGGSHRLSLKLAKVVRDAGGSVLPGHEAVGIALDSEGRPASVSHVEVRNRATVHRDEARIILANCAPDVLTRMLPQPARAACEAAYGHRRTSTSLFSAYFGVKVPPAQFGLNRYGTVRLPRWLKSLRDIGACGRLLADDPGPRLPLYGIANYAAIDSGLPGELFLVSVVGIDHLDNWSSLSADQERARREKWLDAFQDALERDYPGIGSAVAERLFLNARSMHNFLNTPGGAVYGFAPLPPLRTIWRGLPRSPQTPVKGIYLASAFAGFGGFSGSMMSGAWAARAAAAECATAQ